jgi:DNA polymerase epsilon subunit 1
LFKALSLAFLVILVRALLLPQQVDDDELLELISENKTISGLVSDYGAQKITSLTTAARLADYLGGEMLLDKGLNCRLVIANRPFGAPVTDRAIPTLIFKAEKAVQTFWLKKWLKTNANVELRDVIDWQYYNERLGKTIAKIITIPAALQGIPNPVPRVVHPDWLQRKVGALTLESESESSLLFV